VSGHRTSVRLEPVMWDSINDIAEQEAMTLHELVSTVADRRSPGASLTASLRAFIVAYLRAVSSKDQLRSSRTLAAPPVREVAALRA
jgi:predicted DNA-binding ribbon-helix-helix protein